MTSSTPLPVKEQAHPRLPFYFPSEFRDKEDVRTYNIWFVAGYQWRRPPLFRDTNAAPGRGYYDGLLQLFVECDTPQTHAYWRPGECAAVSQAPSYKERFNANREYEAGFRDACFYGIQTETVAEASEARDCGAQDGWMQSRLDAINWNAHRAIPCVADGLWRYAPLPEASMELETLAEKYAYRMGYFAGITSKWFYYADPIDRTLEAKGFERGRADAETLTYAGVEAKHALQETYRMCTRCYDRNATVGCKDCGNAWYCSVKCLDDDAKRHTAEECNTLMTLRGNIAAAIGAPPKRRSMP